MSYVVPGKIFLQIKGQPAQYVNAGSAVYEPADVVVDHFDATEEPSTFIANYLLGADQHDLIRML